MEKQNLINDLFAYIVNNSEFKETVLKQFGIESCVVGNDLNGKQKVYGFVGLGCGITYLKIDRRSKKSIILKDIVYNLRHKVNRYIYDNWFTTEQHKHFEDFGCPIMAVLQQDQQIQIEFYHLVIKYAKEVMGIKKISYISNLD